MNDFLNPYIAGAPVSESSMFFGREDVFTWIENSLTGKFVDHILVLHGQRRVGKTSVLKQIPNFLESQYVQVFFDLQGRANTTLDRFLWWLGSEIVRTLKKQHNIDIARPKQDAFTDPDVFITEFVPVLQGVMGEKILLLTFDEFDTLDRPEIQESLTGPLIAFLRRLFEVEGFNFIFSIGSSGNKLENMQATYTDFFKTALYRKVSFLTRDECHSLITKPVAGVISYEQEAIDRIIYVTSGHPYFTQLTCHELFSRCQKTGSRVITAANVDAILDDVIERGTVNLKFVWDEATDLEKWTLAALGQEEGLSLKEISQLLKSQGVRFVESDLNSAVLHLRDKDVITGDNKFMIQLMKHWLASNRPMDRVREELVQTNPIADRFNEIAEELKDRQQYDDALENYRRALEFQDNNIEALYNIGAIYLALENPSEAAVSFAKALQVDEEHIATRQGYCQAQMALAEQAQDTGDVDEAIKAYLAVLNLTPVHSQARQKLTELYQDQAEGYLAGGLDQKALEMLRLALEINPEDEGLQTRYQAILDAKKAALVASWLDKADKALKRKRWDEAAQMVREALQVDPSDEALKVRLAKIKDAPRQEKINAFRAEADAAIAKRQYPKAISALELAVQLAPEDETLAEKLRATQADHLQAQLRMHATQAAQAEAAGEWVRAVSDREAALALDPENEQLVEALSATKTGQHQARLAGLRAQAADARKAKRWDEAIGAMQELLALEPEDEVTQSELQRLLAAQRQARLDQLLAQGEEAAQQERWEQAVQMWDAYLEEVPTDAEKLEIRLSEARKYAELSADYAAAQDHMRKKQYNRAISKLQGIIAREPTYKASSHLLVEAIEASKQSRPLWRRPWVYIGLVGIIIFAIGLLYNAQLINLVTSILSRSNQASLNYSGDSIGYIDGVPKFASDMYDGVIKEGNFPDDVKSLLAQMDPSFEDDFTSIKPDWGEISVDFRKYPIDEFITDGQLRFGETSRTDVYLPKNDLFSAGNFALMIHFDNTNNWKSGDEITFFFGESEDKQQPDRFRFGFTGWLLIHEDLSNPGYTKVQQGGTITPPGNYQLMLIVLEDKQAIYLDDTLICVNEGYQSTGDTNYLRIRGRGISIEHVLFWNLDDYVVDLDNRFLPILAYTELQPATLTDDFSSPKPEWGLLKSGHDTLPIMNFVNQGSLQLSVNNATLWLPLTPLLNANDFVLEFDFAPIIEQQTSNHFSVGSRFRSSYNHTNYYALVFHPIQDTWQLVQETGGGLELLIQGAYDGSVNNRLRLIAHDNIIAVYLNNLMAGYYIGSGLTGVNTMLFVDGIGSWQVNLDNFHFWSLDGTEVAGYISSEDEPQPTPTLQPIATQEPIATATLAPAWVTDFAEPILATIASQPPHIKDDFESGTRWWLNYHHGNQIQVIKGEMVTHPSHYSLSRWYTDFVIKFDYRFLIDPGRTNSGWGISFRYDGGFSFYEDGSIGGCNEIFGDYLYVAKAGENINHVVIIVKDEISGLYINDQPACYRDLPSRWKSGEVFFGFGRNVALDNIEIWDLNDLP